MKEIVFTDWNGDSVRAKWYRHNVNAIAGIARQLERGYVSQFGSKPGCMLAHTNRPSDAYRGEWHVEGVIQDGQVRVYLADVYRKRAGKALSQEKLAAICAASELDLSGRVPLYDPDDPV